MRPLLDGVVVLGLLFAGAENDAPRAGSGTLQQAEQGDLDAGGGVRLFYRIVGTRGDTVIVLHGGPGFSMSYLAADLAPVAARHVLIFYDQRGTGRSTLVTDSTSLDAQRFGDDLEAVRQHFKLDRVTLVAHSWGAAVAGVYLSKHPDRIRRLLIVDGIAVRRGYHAQGLQTLEARRDSVQRSRLQDLAKARAAQPGDVDLCRRFFRLWFAPMFADSTSPARTKGDFCGDSSAALANKIKSVDRFTLRSLGDWDWRPGLRAVSAPVLVIRGVVDHVPLESAREWAFSPPNGRLLSLDRSGHFPYLDTPDSFFAAVETFLQGKWPTDARAK